MSVLNDDQNRPNVFRFDSIGSGDSEFTYDDAQQVNVELPFPMELVKFAIDKTAFAILAPAIKELVVEGDTSAGGAIVLRTNVGPEFRLNGEMAKQVVNFCRAKGLVKVPTSPSLN